MGINVFRDNNLTSVTFPDNLTYIGENAFLNNSLTSVTLPDSLTYIGNSAFLNNSLTSISIPDSVTTIGGGAFQANNFTSITIPDSITEIGEYAFSYNQQLASAIINGRDTIIRAHAFEGNQSPPANLTIFSYVSSSAQNYAADYGHTFYAFTDLISLTLSEGSLNPVFASGTETYTASVANSVNTIEVTPTVGAGTSSVTVNGETVTSGSASDPIALNVGTNTISVEVTAQDSTTKTYTIEVTRAASSNANLSDLALSEGSLDPAFAPGTEWYSVSVANSVTAIEVTPTVDAGTSSVTVNGETVTSGSASDPIALNVGANAITVVVTAEDNSIKTYTITVTRAASSNANLSGLTLSEGSLDPAFAAGTEAYTASVANSVTAIEVTPTTAVGTSSVTVNGEPVTSGSASDPIALNVGTNTISVEVTAQDSTTKTYTVIVTRAASSNADLSGLMLSSGNLDPAFAPGTEGYSVSVANSVTAIEVTPTVEAVTSSVTVNGNAVTSGSASDPIALDVGAANTITVEVTAEDSTTKTYTITVTRAASSNANLSGLTLSEGSLDPVFAPGTEGYSVSVANNVTTIEVTPTVDAGTSSVTVNDDTVTSGSASDPIALNVGANAITVVVTAEDNSIKTYTITVTRAASSNANLSGLTLSEGSLDPVFAPGTEGYSVSVANNVTAIEVTPTVEAVTSSVTVNGNAVTSGSASDPIALDVGTNTVTVVVTAQDNTTKTYTITVTRAASESSGGGNHIPPNQDNDSSEDDMDGDDNPPTDDQTPVDTKYVMTLSNEENASHTFTFDQGDLLTDVIALDGGSLQPGNSLDAWNLTIPAQTIRALVAYNPEGTVRLQTSISAYDLPVSVFSGINAAGVTEVTLRIGRVDPTILQEMEQAAAAIGARLAAVPVETELAVITSDGKRVVQRYAQYVSQTLALNTAGDPDQQTGVRYHLPEGTFQFVPSRIDGAEATLQSRSGGIETVLVQSKTFVDVDGIWSEEVIKRLASKLIVYGKDEGRFDPDTSVTRAEMTAMLVRSLGLQTDKAEQSHFSDVSPANWYASVVAAAAREGMVQGDGTGKFRPEEHISREETVVMIVSAMRYANIQSKPDVYVDLSFYQDSDLISSWAKHAMAEAVQAGLILGNEENQLMPKKNTSRAEAAAMIDRLLRTIGFID
ncbi:cadherin-like beta sandwich domain-containing protein [Paenibacillus sp. 1P07SE]